MKDGTYHGPYPAVVKSYDAASRLCRVQIPGINDGAEVYPQAEIIYPLGDKSKSGIHSTEIEVLAGDLVWVEFVGGNPEYPVITGYRNPQTGNSLAWRKWHHANIELDGDATINVNAPAINTTGVLTQTGNVTVQGNITHTGNLAETGNITLTGNQTISGNLTVGGNLSVEGSSVGGGGGSGSGFASGDGSTLLSYWNML